MGIIIFILDVRNTRKVTCPRGLARIWFQLRVNPEWVLCSPACHQGQQHSPTADLLTHHVVWVSVTSQHPSDDLAVPIRLTTSTVSSSSLGSSSSFHLASFSFFFSILENLIILKKMFFLFLDLAQLYFLLGKALYFWLSLKEGVDRG